MDEYLVDMDKSCAELNGIIQWHLIDLRLALCYQWGRNMGRGNKVLSQVK